MWRRICLIPFNVQISDDERDSLRGERLRNELPGILNWVLRGCEQWQLNDRLEAPFPVTDATTEYRADMDILGEFLDECCSQEPEQRADNPVLRKEYERWCEENGHHPSSARGLSLQLKERGFANLRNGRTRYWIGIGLKTAVGV